MIPDSKSPALCVVSGGTPPGDAQSRLRALATTRGWRVACVDVADPQVVDEEVALVVSAVADCGELKPQFPHALVVALDPNVSAASDLVVSSGAGEAVLDPLLRHAEEHWRGKLKAMELFREVGARRRRMGQLSDIALSLSTQMDFDELLETILLEARRLAGCDAGSLYLIDETEETPSLVFKLTQNDSIDAPFREQRLPLSTDSLAGYVAQTGRSLEIPDAYAIAADAPYRFNRSFDEQTG